MILNFNPNTLIYDIKTIQGFHGFDLGKNVGLQPYQFNFGQGEKSGTS